MKDDLSGPASCPVCRARFRGSSQCSRCGADLSPLMGLAAQAYSLRQAARQLLRQGNCEAARVAVKEAQRLHRTPEGSLLNIICTATADPLSGQPHEPA
jgi:hypothetical protein